MKKLAVLVSLLMFALTTVCFAKPSKFEKPDPGRWIKISETDQVIMWFDSKSMKFSREKKKDSDCNNHRIADVWFLCYYPNKDAETKNFEHWDLDCRTIQPKSTIYRFYKDDYVYTKDQSYEPQRVVVPDTLMEDMYIILNSLWESENQINKK
ncbi:MAG: hypothetical protein IJ974_03580 [Phascolarctobacterium sp.]|nr:hypothetical protein [Phascolarctobacterium sp.]MBR2220046.1 hypothetical protein [Phascolarctobacterium sp.]MBR6678912.1 hypothetical protein [Phascolarctobacterium sp.]